MNELSDQELADAVASLLGTGSIDPTLNHPTLSRLEREFPTWPDQELPTARHDRRGRDCTAESADGKTKAVSWTSAGSRRYALECCRCGGRRQVINGVTDPDWSDINRALDDPHWCTREKRAPDREGDASPAVGTSGREASNQVKRGKGALMNARLDALLVTPDPERLVVANHNLLMHELVNSTETGNAAGAPFCVGWVVLPPETATLSHQHEDSWTIVIVIESGPEGVDTEGGQQMQERFTQHLPQILVLPPWYPHRARNRSRTATATAIEIRTCHSVFFDRILLPLLDNLGVPAGADRNETTDHGDGVRQGHEIAESLARGRLH